LTLGVVSAISTSSRFMLYTQQERFAFLFIDLIFIGVWVIIMSFIYILKPIGKAQDERI